MSRSFVYEPAWRVLVCVECGLCLLPCKDVWRRHLRAAPHRIYGPELKALVDLFETYDLVQPAEAALPSSQPCAPVPGLKSYAGYRCLLCDSGRTRSLRAARDHASRGHGKKPAECRKGPPLWESCTLQTLFADQTHVRYFAVQQTDAGSHDDSVPSGRERVGDKQQAEQAEQAERDERDERTKLEAQFFRAREADAHKVAKDVTTDADTVHGFTGHRSAVIPWLQQTGIEDHLRGLSKEEIRAAITLPTAAPTGEVAPFDHDDVLLDVLAAMDSILQEAHSWCFDGPDCMLTWPRRVILSRFQSSQIELIGHTRAFEPRKAANTLSQYFGLWKQCLVYAFRMLSYPARVFSGKDRTPSNLIQPTQRQSRALDAVRTGDGVHLKTALIDFCMALICHDTNTKVFSSPIVSFCALLSVKPSTRTWKEPGNLNTNLSGIIWTVQLLIFYHSVCEERKRPELSSLSLMKELCEAYLQQVSESPMGQILRWRLILFKAASEDIGGNHACWDETEEVLTYKETRLRMDQVPILLQSEYKRAAHLLEEELMLGRRGLLPMKAWLLKDRPDVSTFGWHLGHHLQNHTLLEGCSTALIRAVGESTPLKRIYVEEHAGDEATPSLRWREKGIAVYEASTHEFLKSLAVLVHMSNQPIREPEFFSMTWRNTEKRRAIMLMHDRVMIHTTYDKTQQQRGKFRDSIRFLPAPVGELLLNYLVYVLPLRQSFLQQTRPGKLLSPYLWSRGETVWPDNQLTRCLEAASTRAQIPRLHIANWRQMTVAIVKTKFAGSLAYFEDVEGVDKAEMLEPDEDIRIITSQRNHSSRSANIAYANASGGSYGNVWDGLIRRGLRASDLWQSYWKFDDVCVSARKRPRPLEETGSMSTGAKRVAAGIYRPRKRWTGNELLASLRSLYRRPDYTWRSRFQELAVLTVLSSEEQVIIVLPTGMGKSLCYMLPCTLLDPGVTVLVLPLVSLRIDMLRRLGELGIDYLVWSPDERRTARLVVVSAEGACTKGFVAYGQDLVSRRLLKRIVIDECHYTVTAREYRKSMRQLPLLRILHTQFVYLTATLPPSMERTFEHHNYLQNPTVVRCSSNRPNIYYMVRTIPSNARLIDIAAQEAREIWQPDGRFDVRRDKMLFYVQTTSEGERLAVMLGCEFYHSEAGEADEKKWILEDWIQSSCPYLVATSALSAGFDYPHVRVVMHVGAPSSMIDFTQEAGRAGRDGERAYSFVLLPRKWQVRTASGCDSEDLVRDRQAMERYLMGEQCFRTLLSTYLDNEQDKRQCVGDEDLLCDVCARAPVQNVSGTAREPGHETEDEGDKQGDNKAWIGEVLIARRRSQGQADRDRYKELLLVAEGCCMLCRCRGMQWDHTFDKCAERHQVFQARAAVLRRLEREGKRWLAPLKACFWCYNPQSLCGRADKERQVLKCRFRDIVLPTCYGMFVHAGSRQWFQSRFKLTFSSTDEYFEWLGKKAVFAGEETINAVCVTATGLKDVIESSLL